MVLAPWVGLEFFRFTSKDLPTARGLNPLWLKKMLVFGAEESLDNSFGDVRVRDKESLFPRQTSDELAFARIDFGYVCPAFLGKSLGDLSILSALASFLVMDAEAKVGEGQQAKNSNYIKMFTGGQGSACPLVV